MSVRKRRIEVDENTADVLEGAALTRGLSVSELLAELVSSRNLEVESDTSAIAELERRWTEAQADGATVPHDDVVRWLKAWGTPEFKPYHR